MLAHFFAQQAISDDHEGSQALAVWKEEGEELM